MSPQSASTNTSLLESPPPLNASSFDSIRIVALNTTGVRFPQVLQDQPVPVEGQVILFVLSGLVFGIGFLALCYAIKNRQYPPLKAKHLPLLTIAFFGFFFYYLAALHGIGMFGYEGIFSNCNFWQVWLQIVFGYELLLAVLVLRLLSLYQIFVKKQATRDNKLFIPLSLFYLPVLALGIFTICTPSKSSSWYDERGPYCVMNNYFKYSALTVGTIGLMVLGWFTWALRNIRRGFNEFHELRMGFYVLICILVVNSIIYSTHLNYRLWAKYVQMIGSLIGCNIYFWLVLGKPLIGCIFYREQCLRRFIAELNLHEVEVPKEDEPKQISSPKMRMTGYRFASQAGGGNLIPIENGGGDLEGTSFDDVTLPELSYRSESTLYFERKPAVVAKKPLPHVPDVDEEKRERNYW